MNVAPGDEATAEVPVDGTGSISALQDNIERKGKNAYYFAHARKVSVP